MSRPTTDRSNEEVIPVALETLVDGMTLNEQVSLLSGEDSWSLPAITRLGIGKLRVTDGPNGARSMSCASWSEPVRYAI